VAGVNKTPADREKSQRKFGLLKRAVCDGIPAVLRRRDGMSRLEANSQLQSGNETYRSGKTYRENAIAVRRLRPMCSGSP
jgi:hypothetical protein